VCVCVAVGCYCYYTLWIEYTIILSSLRSVPSSSFYRYHYVYVASEDLVKTRVVISATLNSNRNRTYLYFGKNKVFIARIIEEKNFGTTTGQIRLLNAELISSYRYNINGVKWISSETSRFCAKNNILVIIPNSSRIKFFDYFLGLQMQTSPSFMFWFEIVLQIRFLQFVTSAGYYYACKWIDTNMFFVNFQNIAPPELSY